MSIPVIFIIALAAVFAVIVAVRQARVWWKYRGAAVVTCPNDQLPVGVTLDARHAAVTAGVGAPQLRLSSCSRWPERDGCGQPCLSQIAAAPEDCLVKSILTRWYEGKSCAYCGRAFAAVEWASAKPALLQADGVSVEWSQVPAEMLQTVLATARPVCFPCHTANTMVRQHPELVADRSGR